MKKQKIQIGIIIILIVFLVIICVNSINLTTIRRISQNNYKSSTYYEEILSSDITKIYVSPSGKDENTGLSEQQPVKTINKAKQIANNLKAGKDILVILENGEYLITSPLEFTQTDSAEAGHSITYLGNGETIISGGKKLESNWTQEKERIWKIKLTNIDNVNDLYVNGTKQKIAQETITGDYIVQDTKTYIAVPKEKISYNQVKNDVKNISVNMIWEWKSSVLKISSVDQGTNSINFNLLDDTMKAVNVKKFPTYKQNTEQFVIRNAYGLMNEEGEYYYDRNSGYLYLYTSSNPNQQDCVIPISDSLIKMQGTDEKLVSGLNFENIIFKYGGSLENDDIFINQQADGGYYAKDGKISYKMRKTSIYLDHASKISFKNDNFENISSTAIGIDEYVYNVKIENNIFKNVGGTAVRVGEIDEYNNQPSQKDKRSLPSNVTEIYAVDSNLYNRMPANISINNNIMEKVGIEYLSSPAISVFFANQIDINNNSLKDLPYTGIHVGWGWTNSAVNSYITDKSGKYTISGNKIENAVNKLNDGAPIYTLGGMNSGTIIKNNYINTNESEQGYHGGIYIDEGSSYVEASKNVVIDCLNWIDFRQGVNIKNCNIHDNYINSSNEPNSSTANSSRINAHLYDNTNKYQNNQIISNWNSDSNIKSIVNASGATGDIGVIKLEETKENIKLGDINNDGIIDSRDTLRILEHTAATTIPKIQQKHPDWILTGEKFKAGDINGDEIIDSRDTIRVLEYIAASTIKSIAEKHPEWLNMK